MAKVKIASEMVFERHEKKYLLSPTQYSRLIGPLREHMRQDQYGLHTICSLYFDTEDYLLIRRSMDKPAYKEKLRLRSYGMPEENSIVFLELKKKLDGVTYKRRVPMKLCEAEKYLRDGTTEHAGQILEEIGWFRKQYHLEPKAFLCYDRIAFFGMEDAALRVTFDTDIKWRCADLQFTSGCYGAPMLASGERLMEIKMTAAFPCWLSLLLSRLNIYPVSFSKYGKVYQESRYREELKIAR